MKGEYVLIVWPWVQELMGYPWFREECYLMHGFEWQEHVHSSYFVPKKRIEEVRETNPELIIDFVCE